MSESKELHLRASRAADGRARIEAAIGDDVVAADVIDLWSDVERDRLANAIHAAVPALPMLSIQRELLKIDRENLPIVSGPDDPWPETVSVSRPSVPAFPVELLPEPLRVTMPSLIKLRRAATFSCFRPRTNFMSAFSAQGRD